MRKILWLENLKRRENLEDLGVDGKIILDWILGKYGGKERSGCIRLKIPVAGSCEHGSITGGEFLDQLSDY
jgi:hypothetical protein